MDKMDRYAINLVEYAMRREMEDEELAGINQPEVFIVWKAKILKNWKYMIATTREDGLYYEATYNGEKREWYLDIYEKVSNEVIPMDEGKENA